MEETILIVCGLGFVALVVLLTVIFADVFGFDSKGAW